MRNGSADVHSVKEAELLSRDLAMFATAGSYDLAVKSDRVRSASDLSRLFFQVASVLEPDLFIEAGAKDASSSRRARRLLDPKRVVAFEANPYTFERFDKEFDNRAVSVEYRHLALSNEVGAVTFNVNRGSGGQPVADGRGSLLRHETRPGGFIEVTVDATTLDTYFAEHEYRRSALWVDVEGALEQVLTGAQATLERAAVVIVEVEDRAFWGEGQWLRSDVVSYLYDRGLVPVARDFQSRYQYNIVFVHEALLDVDQVRWVLALHHSTAAAGRPSPEAVPSGGGAGEPARPAVRASARAKGLARRYLKR